MSANKMFCFFQALNSTFNNLVIFTAVFEGRNDRLENITFDETETNIGNGMDSSTGIFTVPAISGTFSFSFSGFHVPGVLPNHVLKVYLTDGESESMQTIDVYSQIDFSQSDWLFSYTWTMSLDRADEIYLKLPNNPLSGSARFYAQLVLN